MVTAMAKLAVSRPIAMVSFLFIVEVMVMRFRFYLTHNMTIGVPKKYTYSKILVVRWLFYRTRIAGVTLDANILALCQHIDKLR